MQNHSPQMAPGSSIDMQLRKKAAVMSLVASFIVFGLKALAYYLTRSTAVLSDTLETVVNIVASVVALFVIQYAAVPADEDHPYGHGKVEYFSAAFEGGLIFFAALVIFIEGILSFIRGTPVGELEGGLALVGLATLINLILGLYLKKVGQTQKSETLKASSAHLMSDVVTTGGILLGLGLMWLTHWLWLDALMAVGVAIHLSWEAFKIIRRSVAGLTDEVDIESLEELCFSFEKNRQPGVINIHNLKAIRAGSFHHVDAHLVVPEFWDVLHVHTMTHDFEKDVVKDYPFDGEIAFHMDPCQRKYCASCSVTECPIRKNEFEAQTVFLLRDLVRGPQY